MTCGIKQKEKGKDDKKINRATCGIIVLAVVIVINIITIIIINNIITTMCTEVFLFFRREEICHVVNVYVYFSTCVRVEN